MPQPKPFPDQTTDVTANDEAHKFYEEKVRAVIRRPCAGRPAHPTGIRTADAHYGVDMISLATGFDVLTGALAKIDIIGRGGRRSRHDWVQGPHTYLGLGVDGSSNLFLIAGAPAVLAYMVLHAGGQRGRRIHQAARCP